MGLDWAVRQDEWFLTAAERGNPATRLDRRHGDGLAWSTGNDVTVLVHGVTYFAELLRSVELMRAGDLLLFTDWRGDPDQRLDEAGHRVSRVFAGRRDIETAFRERWEDPARLTRNPINLISDVLRGEDRSCGVLPPLLPDPAACGSQHVHVLRTYPRRRPGYPFAPHGERSVAHAYEKVVGRAQSLIYLEDQYL